jgi:hypothetical protein
MHEEPGLGEPVGLGPGLGEELGLPGLAKELPLHVAFLLLLLLRLVLLLGCLDPLLDASGTDACNLLTLHARHGVIRNNASRSSPFCMHVCMFACIRGQSAPAVPMRSACA